MTTSNPSPDSEPDELDEILDNCIFAQSEDNSTMGDYAEAKSALLAYSDRRLLRIVEGYSWKTVSFRL